MRAGVAPPGAHVLKGRQCRASLDAWKITKWNYPGDPGGTVEREIVVHQLHVDDPITPQQARQLARALIAAADEVGELTD